MLKITETEKIIIGNNLAVILMLKEDFDLTGDREYNPKRYKTIWGNKTALGLYETIKRILKDKEFRMIKPGQRF